MIEDNKDLAIQYNIIYIQYINKVQAYFTDEYAKEVLKWLSEEIMDDPVKYGGPDRSARTEENWSNRISLLNEKIQEFDLYKKNAEQKEYQKALDNYNRRKEELLDKLNQALKSEIDDNKKNSSLELIDYLDRYFLSKPNLYGTSNFSLNSPIPNYYIQDKTNSLNAREDFLASLLDEPDIIRELENLKMLVENTIKNTTEILKDIDKAHFLPATKKLGGINKESSEDAELDIYKMSGVHLYLPEEGMPKKRISEQAQYGKMIGKENITDNSKERSVRFIDDKILQRHKEEIDQIRKEIRFLEESPKKRNIDHLTSDILPKKRKVNDSKNSPIQAK